jgi:hypothetical protein
MRALPSQQTGGDGYDLSVLDVYRSAIEGIERGWGSAATLIDRLSMPMVRLASTASAAGDKDGFLARMAHLARAMSTQGIMLLFGSDELSWTGPSISGYGELLRALAERCSVPEGIPLSRLLGQSPGGLSTDDGAGARTYYDLIERHRRTVLRVALLELYGILRGPADREIVWPSTVMSSDLERGQLSLTYAQRDEVLIRSGVIADAEARERLRDGEGPDVVLLEPYDIEPSDQPAPEVPVGAPLPR